MEYDKHYMARFLAGLMNKYNVSEKEFRETYTYAGGAEKSHLNYYRLRFGVRPFPKTTSHCICGHSIRDNCYMTNGNGRFIVLGNCCIKRHCGDAGYRTCCVCKSRHKNSKNNYCNDCRTTHICKCGKTKKKNFLYCYNCYDSYNNMKKNKKCMSFINTEL
tara:strand:- start:623 stop:1105 length:483 start_codon:yes stop_codon:yes gene_type:complete